MGSMNVGLGSVEGLEGPNYPERGIPAFLVRSIAMFIIVQIHKAILLAFTSVIRVLEEEALASIHVSGQV
jgi:hypothetical protein